MTSGGINIQRHFEFCCDLEQLTKCHLELEGKLTLFHVCDVTERRGGKRQERSRVCWRWVLTAVRVRPEAQWMLLTGSKHRRSCGHDTICDINFGYQHYACSWSLTTNVFKFYSRVPAYLLKQKPSWGLRSNITWTLIIHRLPIWVFFPCCSIQFANQAFTVVSMHSCISWHADELHNIEFIQWMGLELVCQQIHYRVLQRAAAGWWSIRSPSAAVTCI